MKKLLCLLFAMTMVMGVNACTPDEEPANEPATEKPETPTDPVQQPQDTVPVRDTIPNTDPTQTDPAVTGKTLVVYYSYTNNVHTVVSDLLTQIEADAVRIEPAEKGLDYAANNYALGSALIAAIRNNPNEASSYPAIDPVEVKFEDYSTVIVAAPLWWSNMAAPLQTFLFQHGAEMAGKRIGLIVSSASSGISGVESDAKRLIPSGNFLSPSLWVRSSQTATCHDLTAEWLKAIGLVE